MSIEEDFAIGTNFRLCKWLYSMNKIIRYGIFILIVLVYAEHTYAARRNFRGRRF